MAHNLQSNELEQPGRAPTPASLPPSDSIDSGGDAASDNLFDPPDELPADTEFAGDDDEPLLPLFEAGEWWLASYVATTRNRKGQRLARYRLIHYLAVFFRGFDITELNGDNIRGYRLYLEQESGLSANTIVHLLSDLRCLLRWAVSESLILSSPFPARVMPRIQEVPPRGFDDRELRVLTRMGGQAGFILRFLLGTGLRWAEACRARREHVRGALLEVSQTKSGRMRRVPLSPELLAEIAQQGERLVPLAEGSPGSFSRMIRRWTAIDDFHVHRCRHTFAMRWLEAGGNLAVLQQILGHRDLSTTMRYARVTDDLITREAERVTQRQRGEVAPESS